MIDILDLHTHTLASGHAYSTIPEMAKSAKQKGLSLLGIAEHAPAMPGTCHEFYFQNLRVLDRSAYEVPILFGAELNILDEKGTLDMDNELIACLDFSVASIHPPCVRFMSKEECTYSLLKVMENPNIHIIGHPDDGRFPIDYKQLVRSAKDTNTLLEVNNSSLSPMSYRPNAKENYKIMLEECAKENVSIILDSDAHVDTSVGNHIYAKALIDEVHFPEELIVNTSIDKCKYFIKQIDELIKLC